MKIKTRMENNKSVPTMVKLCSICNVTIVYINEKSWKASKIPKCHSCRVGHGITHFNWKSSNEIPFSWFSRYFLRSRHKHTGNITIDDVHNIWIKQNKKCKLSGQSIGFYDVKKNNKNTASGHTCSIDRIDSTKDYTIDNIQLVHRDVNLMKNYFVQDYFISICKMITTNN